MAQNTLVGVKYGGKPGLGRVVGSKVYRGAAYVEVAPVHGGNVTKWFPVVNVKPLNQKASE